MSRLVRRHLARKKPIAGRPSLLGVVASLMVASMPALAIAQDGRAVGLTEVEAVRRGLARSAVIDLLEGEVDVARGDEVEVGLWPNPVLSYSREQTYGGPASSVEDYASLSQSFDFAGRRGLRTDAAGRRVRAASHTKRARRLDIEAELRRRFYEVLLLQSRVAAIREWLERVQALEEIVSRRQAAGDVSGYDRLRLESERARVRARLDVEEAALARARARLAALLGHDPASGDAVEVAGTLLPPSSSAVGEALVARVSERPELRALEETLAAAELDERAAARWWLPELALGGGFKTVDLGTERVTGFLLMASIPLPIFDRHQGESLRARGRARIARASLALELAELRGEVRGLAIQTGRLAEAATRFRADAIQPSADLVRAAEAAYGGGELGILELMDAYRGGLDAVLQGLELEANARRSHIEFERAIGGTPR
jgi:outer membrane protein, heavy metal efflux system